MSQEPEVEPQAIVEPEDPEYEVEQNLKQKRKQQIQTSNFRKFISQNVSDFKPIMDGTVYAFTTLKIRNAGLTLLSDGIKDYQHLRKVDMGMNLFKNIESLLSLKYITHLDLSRNLLQKIQFLQKDDIFPYLKQLNVMGNKIQSLPPITTRCLRKINLNQNFIHFLQNFNGHPLLEVIELRGNKINNLKGLRNMPNLKQLYIAQNVITTLKDMEEMENLMKINCRKNKISNLSNFPKTPKLVYLNLRENQIAKVDDLSGVIEAIKNINLIGNPLQTEFGDNTKKQVWMKFRNFTRINKNQVTEQQKQEFDKEYKERLAEQERERLEKEQAEREEREAREQQQLQQRQAREQQELEEREKDKEQE